MPGLHIPPDTLAQASGGWCGCGAAHALPLNRSAVPGLAWGPFHGRNPLVAPLLQAAHYDYEEKEAAVSGNPKKRRMPAFGFGFWLG